MAVACCQVAPLKNYLNEVLIEGPVEAEELEGYYMNGRLNAFRPPARQKEALISISKLPEGMVYIARCNSEIIGYITFHYPDGYSRWSRHPRVLELGCIEISPDWRNNGIGAALLKEAFSNPALENYIVVTIELCWHWDLKNSGLEMFEYRSMLTKLFGSVGLVKQATDDPDVTEHPANVLMARPGRNVGKEDIILFESMLFEKN
ncbi:MAG: GNAT family N-acetyltransferase [Pelotomaculum sp.]|uniref:N-acetyltransferase domain-containing protein n=1 Tax=Pelotomaculum thermopropionicum (strain DSM 13744 / JCM 10971 / SI) TaxID=370438 RepID=A5D2L6_PELTS|nr:GNAT family N-acetyltransferase [Pelotomaculum sp.]BAF59500.1 hypothetical protein PTH_1319 [Pelotomaculum thermopropionicum SI]